MVAIDVRQLLGTTLACNSGFVTIIYDDLKLKKFKHLVTFLVGHDCEKEPDLQGYLRAVFNPKKHTFDRREGPTSLSMKSLNSTSLEFMSTMSLLQTQGTFLTFLMLGCSNYGLTSTVA